MHGPTPSIFDFTGFLDVIRYGILEVQAPLLRLRFSGYPSHACLECPWCYLDSILSDSPPLGFCWRLRSVFSGRYWARLIDASLVFFGVITFLARFLDSILLRGDYLCRESSMASQTDWYGPSCMGKGGFLTLFVIFPLEGMIVMLKAFAELSRLDLLVLGFYFSS